MKKKITKIAKTLFLGVGILAALSDAKAQCMAIGTNLSGDAQYTGDTSPANADNGARVFRQGITNWGAETYPWETNFFNDINGSRMKVLRFMDWNGTNWSTDVTWGGRTQKGSNNYNLGGFQTKGIAYEWMIDLCNRTGKDMWINVPHQADDNYIWSLAALIRANLNSNLRCFVEYSNETWNIGTFGDRNGKSGQAQYAINKGNQNIPGTSTPFPGANQTYKAQAFYMYKSLRVFKIFQDVWNNNGRALWTLRKVVAYSGNEDVALKSLECLKNTQINPWGTTYRPDFFADAPYVGNNNTFPNYGFQQFKDEVTNSVNSGYVRKFTNTLNNFNSANSSYSMQHIAYEGGQHFAMNSGQKSFFTNNGNPTVWAGTQECYAHMLNTFRPYYKLFCHFVHVAKADAGSAWGSKRRYGQPDGEVPKWRAIRDFLNNNTCGAPREETEEGLPSQDSFIVYPNPADDVVNVLFSNSNFSTDIKIYSLNGSLVQSQSSSQGDLMVTVNTSSLNAGIYVLEISSSEGTKRQKLVVE